LLLGCFDLELVEILLSLSLKYSCAFVNGFRGILSDLLILLLLLLLLLLLFLKLLLFLGRLFLSFLSVFLLRTSTLCWRLWVSMPTYSKLSLSRFQSSLFLSALLFSENLVLS